MLLKKLLTYCLCLYSPQCMGISQASIDAIIMEGDGGGLKYVCTEFWVQCSPRGHGDGNSAVDKAALSQLFMTMRNLAANVGSLVQQMSG